MRVDTPRTTMTVAAMMPMTLTCKLSRANIPCTPRLLKLPLVMEEGNPRRGRKNKSKGKMQKAKVVARRYSGPTGITPRLFVIGYRYVRWRIAALADEPQYPIPWWSLCDNLEL